MNYLLKLLWLLMFFLIINNVAMANKTNFIKLTFSTFEQNKKSFTSSQLKAQLKVHQISLFDHYYNEQKQFNAYAIHDVLNLAYGKQWKNGRFSDATFTATDGYKSVTSIEKLAEKGGYLAFSQSDGPFQVMPYKSVIPGPFYLVWTGKTQTAENNYPWPWQLTEIDLTGFQDKYPEVFPQGKPTEVVFQGYELFKRRCFKCHAMNQQGGKIGPDLNAPQSIIDYRESSILKKFIKEPSKFRYSIMPDNLDLTTKDLNALIEYFTHKRNDIYLK